MSRYLQSMGLIVMALFLKYVLSGCSPSDQIDELHRATTSSDEQTIFFDDFETHLGWLVNPESDDSAVTGQWQRGNPRCTRYQKTIYQMGRSFSGQYALVTGAKAGRHAGSNDVDNGVTSVRSPLVKIPEGCGCRLSLMYYLSHYRNAEDTDGLRITLIGDSYKVLFEEFGSHDIDPAEWEPLEVFVPEGYAGQEVYFLIEAFDVKNPSLLESAIDDVRITCLPSPGPTPTPDPGPHPTPIPPTPTPAPTPPTPTPIPPTPPPPLPDPIKDLRMVEDIRPGVGSSNVYPIGVVGDRVILRADDGLHGSELWTSDGTPGGTVLLKDIVPGSKGSSPAAIFDVATRSAEQPNNDLVFFLADDGVHGYELWKTDGTQVGTVMVKDIYPGVETSKIGYAIMLKNEIYFVPNDGEHGHELWKSDGTEAGTVMVKDILPGSKDSRIYIGTAIATHDRIFFAASDGVHGVELWVSDGSDVGTFMVKDIFPGAGDSRPDPMRGDSWWLSPFSDTGQILFSANDGIHGHELWISNGTQAGTHMLKDIEPGIENYGLEPLGGIRGLVFFIANDGVHGVELWQSDGTPAGTIMTKDILAGEQSTSLYPGVMLKDNYFFFAGQPVNQFEPWLSDGTESGTFLIKEIMPGSMGCSPGGLTRLGDRVFFTADDGVHGFELWMSDATTSGTMLVSDLQPGEKSSFPHPVIRLHGKLFFSAITEQHGRELWILDTKTPPEPSPPPLPPGVSEVALLKDIRPGEETSFPRYLGVVQNQLIFCADDGVHGPELWKSDGTVEGTVLVKDIIPGKTGSNPDRFGEDMMPIPMGTIDGYLLFTANDNIYGRELWKTDGTDAGTMLVKDINSGENDSGALWIGMIDDKQFVFNADDGIHGKELWVSDGTQDATVMIKDILPGPEGSSPVSNYPINGERIFFVANDGSDVNQLWVTDGTEAGTYLVKGIQSQPGVPGFLILTVIGDKILFRFDDGIHGSELWVSDGTEKGTTMVRDVIPGSMGSNPRLIASMGAYALIGVYNGIDGTTLWRSDGTQLGTFEIKDILVSGSWPYYATRHNDRAYFRARIDNAHGNELWSSDGTESATFMIKDIFPGPESSNPFWPHSYDDVVFFNSNDGVFGSELWMSDGTAQGTTIVKDIAPGIEPSHPSEFITANNLLFFMADDKLHGFEIWVLKTNP